MNILETFNKKITKQEFLDSYGEIIVKFNNYYKYGFGYVGYTEESDRIYISIGGDSEKAYNISIDLQYEYSNPYRVKDLIKYANLIKIEYSETKYIVHVDL